MKNYLNPETVNVEFTTQAIENTFLIVKSTFRYDKSQPYRNYYCTALIDNVHLKKYGKHFILLRKDANSTLVNKLVKDVHPCNVSTIPEQLFLDAANCNSKFTHVMVERRMFNDNKQEVRVVIPPNQAQLGYSSNSLTLSKKGLAFLEGKEFISLRRKMLAKLHVVALRLHQLAEVLQLSAVHNSKKAA